MSEGAAEEDVNGGIESLRVLVSGSTGTAGQATTQALVRAGHHVTCLVRKNSQKPIGLPDEVQLHMADVTDPDSILSDGFRGAPFDALVSCLASRSGVS